MTTNTPAKTTIEVLDALLENELMLKRAGKLGDFLANGTGARYLRQPRLTVAQHFDIEPAFLILDPLLGSLGVVEHVPAAIASVEEFVRRAVDHAAYLRHLLLRDQSRKARHALAVELVLLVDGAADDPEAALGKLGEALRKTLRESDSLFHVGVGVLEYCEDAADFGRRLRRAFPWLLTATHRWLGSKRASVAQAAAPAPRRLRSVQLENYRLPGVRKLELENARVHLLHGPNGTGKSTLAEALEIAASGRVERLEQAVERRYDEVIRSASSVGPASIGLEWDPAPPPAKDPRDPNHFAVEATGVMEPVDATVSVSSFRLDQPLMDRLVGSFPHARAQTFLRAFFPEAVEGLARYEQAEQAHQQASLRLQGLVKQLSAARDALTALQDWRGGHTPQTGEHFPTVLNRWLEQTALVDLLERIQGVEATLRMSSASGWSSHDPAAVACRSALQPALTANQLSTFIDDGKRAIDDLQAKLGSFTATPSDTVSGRSQEMRVDALAVDALNAVSPLILPSTVLASHGHLGHKLAAVLNAQAGPTYGHIIIGSEQWAEPLLKNLDAMLDACRELQTDLPPSLSWPGPGASADYEAARQAHTTRLEAGKVITDHFLDKLKPDEGKTGAFDGSLIAALNELMALFTPARWAYEDIALPTVMDAGQVALTLNVANGKPDTRAELRFNTAELNVYTVALFLLCVGRVPKPLNLLVFDDPLQNMDELTSTAVARGIGKVVRLWASLSRTEELLFLFHGADDLERFRAELAGATYRLHWLSPGPEAKELVVNADKVTPEALDVLAVQSIDGMQLSERRNDGP